MWVGKDVAATAAVNIGAKPTADNEEALPNNGQAASGTLLELAGAPAYEFSVDLTVVVGASPAASGAAAVCNQPPAANETHNKCVPGPSW